MSPICRICSLCLSYDETQNLPFHLYGCWVLFELKIKGDTIEERNINLAESENYFNILLKSVEVFFFIL